ncbi:hypothetical protein HK102_000203 [Quaeritorhiza haematococci]|nr:hypothetical protein HK102_000203 [Quaeritorhiza haematococci]
MRSTPPSIHTLLAFLSACAFILSISINPVRATSITLRSTGGRSNLFRSRRQIQDVGAIAPILEAGSSIRQLLAAGKVDEEQVRKEVWHHLSGPDGVITPEDVQRLSQQLIPHHTSRLVTVTNTHPFIRALPDIKSDKIDKDTFATQVWTSIMQYQPGCACAALPPSTDASGAGTAFLQIFDKVACSIDVHSASQCGAGAGTGAPAAQPSEFPAPGGFTIAIAKRDFWSFFTDMVAPVVHVVTAVVQAVVNVFVDPIKEAFNLISGVWHIVENDLRAVVATWTGAVDFIKNPRALQQSLWDGAKAVFNILDKPYEVLTNAINKFVRPSVEWVLNYLDFLGPIGFFMHGMIAELIDQGMGLLTLLTPTGIFHFVADLKNAIVPLFDMENIKKLFGGMMEEFKNDPVKAAMTLFTVAGNPAQLAVKFIVDDITSKPDEKSKWMTAGKWATQILLLVVPFLGEESAAVGAAKAVRTAETAGAFLREEAVFGKPALISGAPVEADVAAVTTRLQSLTADAELFSTMASDTFWTTDAQGFKVLRPDRLEEFKTKFSPADRERFGKSFPESNKDFKIKPGALELAGEIVSVPGSTFIDPPLQAKFNARRAEIIAKRAKGTAQEAELTAQAQKLREEAIAARRAERELIGSLCRRPVRLGRLWKRINGICTPKSRVELNQVLDGNFENIRLEDARMKGALEAHITRQFGSPASHGSVLVADRLMTAHPKSVFIFPGASGDYVMQNMRVMMGQQSEGIVHNVPISGIKEALQGDIRNGILPVKDPHKIPSVQTYFKSVIGDTLPQPNIVILDVSESGSAINTVESIILETYGPTTPNLRITKIPLQSESEMNTLKALKPIDDFESAAIDEFRKTVKRKDGAQEAWSRIFHKRTLNEIAGGDTTLPEPHSFVIDANENLNLPNGVVSRRAAEKLVNDGFDASTGKLRRDVLERAEATAQAQTQAAEQARVLGLAKENTIRDLGSVLNQDQINRINAAQSQSEINAVLAELDGASDAESVASAVEGDPDDEFI